MAKPGPPRTLSGRQRSIQLTEQQDEFLKAYSTKTGIPVAELIRHAVDLYQAVNEVFHD